MASFLGSCQIVDLYSAVNVGVMCLHYIHFSTVQMIACSHAVLNHKHCKGIKGRTGKRGKSRELNNGWNRQLIERLHHQFHVYPQSQQHKYKHFQGISHLSLGFALENKTTVSPRLNKRLFFCLFVPHLEIIGQDLLKCFFDINIQCQSNYCSAAEQHVAPLGRFSFSILVDST